MSARRWPLVTFAFIAINLALFLVTHTALEEQATKLADTKAHILLLAAMHPELRVPPEVQPLVDNFQQQHPEMWKHLQDPSRPAADAWDAQIRLMDEYEQLQDEMDALAAHYTSVAAVAMTEKYAFVPANPQPVSYLTANFLHGGWAHLIGNMWFLWLAGFVLEDVWGRFVYSAFYLIAGAAALQVHTWTNPGSMIPTLGASGAVAGLMGAFLVRFPTMKLDMGWIFAFRLYRFKMAAYWLLPMWLVSEIFYGTYLGQMTGVAHWAHVGGFVFGALLALGLRFSGVEHVLNQSIESKVSLTADPEITQASDLIEQNQCDQAVAVLEAYLADNPESVDAVMLLQQAYRRKGDLPAFYEALTRVCQPHFKAREHEAAWQDFEDFLSAGGDRATMPAAIWLDLCRVAENQQNYDRALSEYEKLAATHASQRQALEAQLGAARIYLKRLDRPQDALKLFEAASASPVPHLDLEPAIEAGIRAARAALTPASTPSAAPA
jgi:membrane associated rhomboid family serine protease